MAIVGRALRWTAAGLVWLLAGAHSLAQADLWELRGNYQSAREVEICPSGDDTAEAAKSARERFRGFDLRVLEPGALGADASLPRVLMATLDRLKSAGGGPIADYLERLGVEWLPNGFRFHGRNWTDATDGLVATFEDPDRPGMPLTIWFANSEAALASYVTGLEPVWTPGFAAFRAGETELEGPLAVDGRLPTTRLIDRRIPWRKRFENDTPLALAGFNIRMPVAFEVDRAQAYLKRVSAARARSFAWADETGEAISSPTAAIGVTSLAVHGHVEEMLQLLGAAELSRVNPVTGRVHVLLATGLADDRGAAVAQASVQLLLGAPEEAWMGEAAGVYGANAWWGRDLSEWVAGIANGDLAPPLAEVLGFENTSRFQSPHLVGPLRGFWFGHMLETRGAEFVRAMWKGETAPTGTLPVWETLEEEYRTALADLGAEKRDLLESRSDSRRTIVQGVAWRAGAALVPGPEGAGYGSRSCAESLAQLSGLGANSFSMRVFAYREEAGAPGPGRLHPERVPASESDLVLASAAAAGKALGMSHMLQPHLLSKPWGNYTASQALTSAERVEEFFVDLLPFTVHYALLAELIGSEILCVGTGLSNTTQPDPEDRSPEALAIGVLKQAGWRDQIANARSAFHGLVTYSSASSSEAKHIEFSDACDLVATELFTSLGPSALADQAPQRASLMAKLSSLLGRQVEIAREKGKRVLITGIGFASTEDSWRRPHLARGATSPAAQALLLGVLADALQARRPATGDALAGIYLWNWSSYPAAGGLAERGFTPQNKPGLQHLPGIFGTQE